jgi:hypothetical protein
MSYPMVIHYSRVRRRRCQAFTGLYLLAPRPTGSVLLTAELRFVEVPIEALLRVQLSVGASLHDSTRVHDEDLIGVADGGEPMRDDYRRAVPHRLV